MLQIETFKKCILLVVCTVLLLDNMIYMVIIPIIPGLLQMSNALNNSPCRNASDNSTCLNQTDPNIIRGFNDISITILFASKAIVQLFISPFSGGIIDKFGSKSSLIAGLSLLACSTGMFSIADSYNFLLSARCLQGIGSAFADTSGFTLIAETFIEPGERSKSLGISLAFISFGTLAAPPFGGILYQLFGRRVPFIVLSIIALCDLFIFLFLTKYNKEHFTKTVKRAYIYATPIWKLLMDPYIALCAGALSVANIPLAFIEPTIGIWMSKTMNAQSWQIGFVWFPALFPHWIGVYLTVWLMQVHSCKIWILAGVGLIIEAIMCIFVPICKNYWVLIIPISGICFGNAIIDSAILPMVAHLTDTRHASIYGSSYAIVDISYNLAYAIGPIVASSVMHMIGFTYMNMLICCVTIVYAPLLKRLGKITFQSVETIEIEHLIQ